MALSAKEWLLKGIGDSSDARRDLDETAAKLDHFDGTEAEAEVQLQTQKFKDEVAGARAELKALAAEDPSPEVDLQTAGLKAHLREVEAQLAIFSQKSYEADVDVDTDPARRGMTGFLGVVKGVWDSVGNLFADGAKNVGSSMVGMGGSVSTDGTASVSTFGKVAGEVAAIAGVGLVAALGAAATAAVALASSLALAVAGLVALGIAAAALVIPIGVVAAGAVAVFKDSVNEAGSAASKLKATAGEIADTFKSVLRPAADAVFKGLNAGLQGVPSLLRSLKGPLTDLGKSIGGAFKALGKELTSGPWRQFFQQITKAATTAVPLLTGTFIGLLRILRNIASAAMPFLIRGLKAIEGWIDGISKSTGNLKETRSTVGGLVTHLRAWVKLSGALSSGFFGVIKAAAPAGLELVRWLTKGAQKISDWVNSAEGQERIKQFFTDVLPLVKEMVNFFGQLAIVAIELFQAVAPSLAFFFNGLNLLLKPVIALLELFNRIPASLRSWLLPFGAVISTISTIIGIAKSLMPIFSGVAAAVARLVTAAPGAAWRWIQDRANAVAGAVTGIFRGLSDAASAVLSAGKAAWGWISQAARNVSGAVRGVISGLAGAVGAIVSRAVGNAWHWLTDAARGASSAVKGVVSALVGWVKARVNDAIDVIQSIISAINAVRAKASAAAASLVDAIKAPVNAMIDGINAIQLHLSIHKGLPGPVPDINIDATVDPFPNIPHLARGVRDFVGGMAWVGETGPELVALPGGSDVFTSGDSRRMTPGMGHGLNIEQVNITPAEGEWIDETDAVAQLNHRLRTLGAWD